MRDGLAVSDEYLVPEPATGGFVVLQDDGETDSAGNPAKDVTVRVADNSG